MTDIFLDIWVFATSQIGIFAVGVLVGSWWGKKLKDEVGRIIDKIDQD